MNREIDVVKGQATVTCGCGATMSIHGKANSKPLPTAALRKKFHQHGWRLGRTPRRDKCPKCTNNNKENGANKVTQPTNTQAADTPRQPTRDQRRTIFSELEGVYLDERRGYDGDWDDAKVAQALNMPRAWVAHVREENFGPEQVGVDPKVLASLNLKLAGAEATIKKAGDEYTAIDAAIKAAQGELRNLHQRLTAAAVSLGDAERAAKAVGAELEKHSKK